MGSAEVLVEEVTGLNLLERMVLGAFWRESVAGWRKLDPNETRFSQSPECSHQLFYDKVYPEPAPDLNEPEFKRDSNGIITVKNGKATIGTWIHEGIQKNVRDLPMTTGIEKVITVTGNVIKMSGHIDIEFTETAVNLGDIKTVGIYVFPGIAGERSIKPDSYTEAKRESSIIQGNNYAVADDCEWFYIIWVSRDEGRFKIELFKPEPKILQKTLKKLANVDECYQEAINAGKIVRLPRFEGVCMCDLGKNNTSYCRHHANGIGGDFPEKSAANCPGRFAIIRILTDEAKYVPLNRSVARPSFDSVKHKYAHVDPDGTAICDVCNKPFSEVIYNKDHWYLPQHLWYDHGIHSFEPDHRLPGKRLE
jgi:hypothetical protein